MPSRHRRGRGLPLSILNLRTTWRWLVSAITRLLYPWERDPALIVQVTGWASRLVWVGPENHDPTVA